MILSVCTDSLVWGCSAHSILAATCVCCTCSALLASRLLQGCQQPGIAGLRHGTPTFCVLTWIGSSTACNTIPQTSEKHSSTPLSLHWASGRPVLTDNDSLGFSAHQARKVYIGMRVTEPDLSPARSSHSMFATCSRCCQPPLQKALQ
jgi:hypothetical protein